MIVDECEAEEGDEVRLFGAAKDEQAGVEGRGRCVVSSVVRRLRRP